MQLKFNELAFVLKGEANHDLERLAFCRAL